MFGTNAELAMEHDVPYHFKGVSLAEIEAFPGSHVSDHESGATRVVVGLPLCSRLLGRQRRPCVSLDASPTLRASIVRRLDCWASGLPVEATTKNRNTRKEK
jgi:hypothetical protein